MELVDTQKTKTESINPQNPSCVFVRFSYEFEIFDIDTFGNTIPKPLLSGGAKEKKLIKITATTKEELVEKLTALLSNYEKYIEGIKDANQ